MLYVTTRNNRDTFTSQRALRENRAQDGGFYVPFREPELSGDAWNALTALPFEGRIAQILNLLFQTQLSQWDVRFAIGRSAVKLISLRHRITVGEFWHNPGWSFAQLEKSLYGVLCGQEQEPTDWARIAIRVAILGAVLPELAQQDAEGVDVSVLSGDFLWPISAWYARKWGFPVGNIIACCNENQSLWELICHGQLRTDGVSIPTQLPEADVSVPADLERLIFACGGAEEAEKYLQRCRQGRTYFASEPVLTALRKGLYVSVVSSSRLQSVIRGIFRTHQYLACPETALAYGGLLDYRAKKGAIRPSLVISGKSPRQEAEKLSRFLGIPEAEILQHI